MESSIIEEAKKKYSISERIRMAEQDENDARKRKSALEITKARHMQTMLKKRLEHFKKIAKLATITGKVPSDDKTLIIVGGQSGAGKSRLVKLAQKDLMQNGVIVDFDELRSYHPDYEMASAEYPESTHAILHEDTEYVKNKILKDLIKEKYNVIYEGALRNTQGVLDFAQDFRDNDYNIKMMLMAVPALESYGSTFIRYVIALQTDKIPRWVEKYAHDGSYEGVLRTVQSFKDQNLVDSIGVYVRSKEEPQKIYETQEHQFSDAIEAIKYGRESGREQAVQDYQEKYDVVTTILKSRQPEMVEKLSDWKQLYENEKRELSEKQQNGMTIDED